MRLSPFHSSLKSRLHFAAAQVAGFVTRPRRLRPYRNPMLALIGVGFGTSGEALLSVEEVSLRVPLSDAYWMTAGMDGEYEPDIFNFLDGLKLKNVLFVDCGANIGLWSLIAEKRWGWTSAAIEASSALVRRIEQARVANRAEFQVLRFAIWKSDADVLRFRTGATAHAGGHLDDVEAFVADWRLPSTEEVLTITIDTIVNTAQSEERFAHVIVKLDVEGAECEAIEGAQQSLADGALLIYEDHGNDPECRPTQMLLAQGLNVYSLEGGLQPISSVEEAVAIKTNKLKGYNFLASILDLA